MDYDTAISYLLACTFLFCFSLALAVALKHPGFLFFTLTALVMALPVACHLKRLKEERDWDVRIERALDFAALVNKLSDLYDTLMPSTQTQTLDEVLSTCSGDSGEGICISPPPVIVVQKSPTPAAATQDNTPPPSSPVLEL